MSDEPRMTSKEIADLVKCPHSRIRGEVMNAEGSQYYEDRKHFPNPVPRETIVDEDGELRDAFLLNAQQVQVVMRRLKGIPGLRVTKKVVLARMGARVRGVRPKKAQRGEEPVVENTEALTTSRKIADLLGARHDHVKQTIERLARRGRIQPPSKRKVLHRVEGEARVEGCFVFEGEIGERDAITVVAQRSYPLALQLLDQRLGV